jgi:hypothetical protein
MWGGKAKGVPESIKAREWQCYGGLALWSGIFFDLRGDGAAGQSKNLHGEMFF